MYYLYFLGGFLWGRLIIQTLLGHTPGMLQAPDCLWDCLCPRVPPSVRNAVMVMATLAAAEAAGAPGEGEVSARDRAGPRDPAQAPHDS